MRNKQSIPVILCACLLFSCANRSQQPEAKQEDLTMKTARKAVVYQVFTRLFGNTNTTNEPWGTLEENGVGKFADFTPEALEAIRDLGVTHIWYTGVLHHAMVTDYSAFGLPADDPDVVKGRAGSPYAVKDYYNVNPDLATDVAARGIDVDDVTHVIHYQLPDEIETYTHRSGRTGRAGKSGVSLIILTRSELGRIRTLIKITGRPFEEKPLPSGMEICEIQLYHLADSIRNTEIHPEVESFLPAVKDLLEGLDRDALIAKMVSVEFSRFAEFYAKKADLKGGPGGKVSNDELPSDGPARFFINVGERDGLDWMILKDMLKEATGLGKEDIFKVETKDSFSFFSTEAALAPLILESLKGANLEGRDIHVELSSGQTSRGGQVSRGGQGARKGPGKPWKKDGKPGYKKKGKADGKASKKDGKKGKKRNGYR